MTNPSSCHRQDLNPYAVILPEAEPRSYPSSCPRQDLADRLAAIRVRIAAAAERAGRDASSVQLLPVTKTQPVEVIEDAMAAGLTRFAENRPQELAAKRSCLRQDDPEVTWVLIGPLQTNKARLAARFADQFQALDSLRTADALDRRLQALGRGMDVLVEVNTSGEPAKHGVVPSDAPALARALSAYQALRPVGLMTVAVNSPDEQAVRSCFRRLVDVQRHLRDDGLDWPELSMGMSGDFEWAIEEGSTIVRLGTALFGPRPAKGVG